MFHFQKLDGREELRQDLIAMGMSEDHVRSLTHEQLDELQVQFNNTVEFLFERHLKSMSTSNSSKKETL